MKRWVGFGVIADNFDQQRQCPGKAAKSPRALTGPHDSHDLPPAAAGILCDGGRQRSDMIIFFAPVSSNWLRGRNAVRR
jgi:hypothetical protein